MMLLDVIYVNFNSTKFLINSINSIYKNKGKNKLNVIVVDNSSGDDPHQLKKLFPEIKLILNKENTGFGAAINAVLVERTRRINIEHIDDAAAVLLQRRITGL